MTSTEFTVGLDGSRVSSKVLRPPGGGSSDIFGTSRNTSRGLKPEDGDCASTQNRLFGGGDATFTPGKRQIKTNMFEHQTPLGPAAPRKPTVRRNPITGEEIVMYAEKCEKTETNGREETNGKEEINDNVSDNIVKENNEGEEGKAEEEVAPPKPVVTSIRVRNPPGGKSSGIF